MARRNAEYIVAGDGKTTLRGFNIYVGRKRTSVRLSPVVVFAIEKIAKRERCELNELYGYIDRTKERGVSRATAIKNFVIRYFMDAATEAGHRTAGHGKLVKKVSGRR